MRAQNPFDNKLNRLSFKVDISLIYELSARFYLYITNLKKRGTQR